jgi:hypothetical protein
MLKTQTETENARLVVFYRDLTYIFAFITSTSSVINTWVSCVSFELARPQSSCGFKVDDMGSNLSTTETDA